MIATRASGARDKAEDFVSVDRLEGETNSAWVARQLETLTAPSPSAAPDERDVDDPTFLLLTGGRGPLDFRLRVAQSHLRHDLSPSHWSHAALVQRVADPPAESVLVEVSLDPEFGFALPAAGNGLQSAYLGWYDDPAITPNIAVLRIPVSGSIWSTDATADSLPLLEQFAKQRQLLDVPPLILKWLAFLWGAGTEGNPLLAGFGVPTAAALETLMSAAGYDISPGLDSRGSSPEAFWQTASWWHPFYAAQNLPPLRGAWCITHRIEQGTPHQRTEHVGARPDLNL